MLLATKVLFCLTSKLLSVLPPKPFVVGTCSTLISLRVVFLLYATVATASMVVHNQIMIYALKGRETWPLEPLRCIQGTETYLFHVKYYVSYLSVSSCMCILIALEDDS